MLVILPRQTELAGLRLDVELSCRRIEKEGERADAIAPVSIDDMYFN
jgi:hypothetical protein